MSLCVGNFYFWQTVTTLGFCHYLRRLGAKFPPQIPVDVSITVDVGITTEQLLEEKEKSLTEAATKNDELDKQNALLREKVDRLERDLEFTSNDRYELIRKTCTLQNRLGDFQSWPQFREEYDLLVTECVMMQRQRAREDISHQQMLHIAKEARLELASANRAAAMSKTAHSEELILLKRERDDARENYETLVSTTNAAAAAAAATATKGNTPGDKVLQEENTRLTLALRSQTSLLAKKTSEFERMQSLLKSRSNHSASQLSEAASTILSLEEEKKKGNKRIAKLEKELTEAKEKAEEMEEMYLAVAFADMGKGEEDVKAEDEEEEEGEEEDGSGEQPPTSWLLKQVVAMSKKEGSKAGAPGADKSGISDDEEEDSENDEDDMNEEDDEDDEDGEDRKNEEEEEEKRIHDENEDLFKDMMGSP